MNQKLTLSVDSAAVARGKEYAAQNGVTLSGLVEDFLLYLDPDEEFDEVFPISPKLQSLIGIGAGVYDEADYRAHLEKRHG